MKRAFCSVPSLCALVLWLFQSAGSAAMYYNYQTYAGNGVIGPVGSATLGLSNNNTTVRANFIKGPGSFSDNLVIFVDCAPGGISTTALLTNRQNALECAVSGFNVSRSVANFAPGFEADYAIVIGINSGSAVFKIVDDGTGPRLQLVRNGLNFVYTDSPNHPSYSFQFDWANIGLPNQDTNFFKFETSYIKSTGSRHLEGFEQCSGADGFETIDFSNYDTYGVPPVPETTTVALAVFGGIAFAVSCRNKLRRSSGRVASG